MTLQNLDGNLNLNGHIPGSSGSSVSISFCLISALIFLCNYHCNLLYLLGSLSNILLAAPNYSASVHCKLDSRFNFNIFSSTLPTPSVTGLSSNSPKLKI